MIAIIILSVIFLIFFLILIQSVTVYVKIKTDLVTVKVGVAGIKKLVYPTDDKEEEESEASEEKSKKQKKEKSKKKKQPDKNKDPNKEKVTERTFKQTLDLAVNIIKAVAPPVEKLVSKIRIVKLMLFMTVAKDDAYETSMAYGETCAVVYSALSAVNLEMKVKPKSIAIIPDYISDEPRYDVSFKAKLRLWWVLVYGIKGLFRFLKSAKSAEGETMINKPLNSAHNNIKVKKDESNKKAVQ